MLVGIARTSTAEQVAGLEAQVRELEAVGCEKVFRQQVSATVVHRQHLEDAIAYVREGDVLVATKPDRLARSTADLLAIVARLEAKGVGLRILSMGGSEVDTTSPTGRLMLTMLAAVAEFERNLMLERQREGIAKAKAERRYKGRAPTAKAKTNDVLRLHGEGMRPVEIVRQVGISRASVYRIIKDVQEEKAAA